ncbi:WD40 repeat-like protein [Punctularia strigosozonata HHB-11173 SS5]|uniref:WD40 repeat-like protein n=1 Tax=Punctularia strigosozonata (strain HHB-11173) TaxID=741275 RepID=R7S0B7_PUNST|nr:WD40 repeat-like protein [Punctularia strigosozonata HHB-11173 SS5]EIN03683.1 WD40 repeat-like protein [Punctularia strigosozonata HHB-11173 SS5]
MSDQSTRESSDSSSDHPPPPAVPQTAVSGASPVAEETRGPSPVLAVPESDEKLSCGCLKQGRNLVVCIDGTANQFGLKNTNVVELYSRLVDSNEQLAYYDSGIGTYVKERFSLRYVAQVIDHTIDMAIAWNFKEIVLKAYEWLSENYRAGDRIFLFGFSRGAYQARVLAGMIQKVGLLKKGNNRQIRFAYELYESATAHQKRRFEDAGNPTQEDVEQNNRWRRLLRKMKRQGFFASAAKADARPLEGSADEKGRPALGGPSAGKPAQSDAKDHGPRKKSPKEREPEAPSPEDLCKHFKSTLSRENVKVHFVGAWDTVSSVGIARGPTLPETTTGMSHVCAFRHALALDELRVKFLPEYANGGAGPKESKGNVKEVWFAGSHSDIGGGNLPNLESDRFGPALRWMTYEADLWGLRMKADRGKWHASELTKSMNWFWWFLASLPIKRLSYKDAESTKRWPPHRAAPRKVMEGQLIHESVFELIHEPVPDVRERYIPRARLPPTCSASWDSVELKYEVKMEEDSYVSARAIIGDLNKKLTLTERQIERLADLPSSGKYRGRQLIIDYPNSCTVLLDALERESGREDGDTRSNLLTSVAMAMTAFRLVPHAQTRAVAKLRRIVDMIARDTPEKVSAANQLLNLFRDRQVIAMEGHRFDVTSVAFSPDGSQIASGSWDSTIRIWNADTGKEIREPLRGHTRIVTSLSFSPDGKRLASASNDETVRLWDVRTGQQTGQPLEGHTFWVYCVAFSPDGNRIVSGSADYTLRLWDAQTGQAIGEPLRGHSGLVKSVAFSPDGKHIASGSMDSTIRLWDAGTGKSVGDPLRGHDHWVLSVAYSPDGARIVSGSDDNTIRIWDTQTRQTVLGPLQGHEKGVTSMAFSPDGKYVVSGSWDGTMRIWDAQTGQTVAGPWEAHDDKWVRSIAFSPDGKRVASGGGDYMVKIWDAEIV